MCVFVAMFLENLMLDLHEIFDGHGECPVYIVSWMVGLEKSGLEIREDFGIKMTVLSSCS